MPATRPTTAQRLLALARYLIGNIYWRTTGILTVFLIVIVLVFLKLTGHV